MEGYLLANESGALTAKITNWLRSDYTEASSDWLAQPHSEAGEDRVRRGEYDDATRPHKNLRWQLFTTLRRLYNLLGNLSALVVLQTATAGSAFYA